MNMTVCNKDGGKGKVIRNWDRQCRSCEHCRIVAVRLLRGGETAQGLALYLFQCPHVSMRHKIIGADVHHSQPRTRTDLVVSGFYLKCGQREIDAFVWQDYDLPLHGETRMQIAEIPCDRWDELIY